MNAKMPSEDEIKSALKAVKYPGYSRDVVSFGLVKETAAKDGLVSVTLSSPRPKLRWPPKSSPIANEP